MKDEPGSHMEDGMGVRPRSRPFYQREIICVAAMHEHQSGVVLGLGRDDIIDNNKRYTCLHADVCVSMCL